MDLVRKKFSGLASPPGSPPSSSASLDTASMQTEFEVEEEQVL
jgi:hypothetical protein